MFLCLLHIKSSGSVKVNYSDKMDVLDLIIETLKEHEKTLDELAFRLERCMASTGSPLKPPEKEAQLESWR